VRLSDLDSKNLNINVVLLQTPSTKLTMFLQDKVKRKYKCKNDSIIDIGVKSDYKKVKEVLGTTPPFSDKWYVSVDLDKTMDKELIELVKQSYTCVFFCTCSKYKTFKQFKEGLKDMTGVFDFYINYLRRPDFLYLYDAFTLSDNKLNKQLFDYAVQSYSGDIEAVFELLIHLNQGEKFENRKEIAEICGLGSLSIESYIFTLLKELSGSDKGLATVIKNRVKAGVELGEAIGFSSMYNFMSRSLLLFCELKMLVMSGIVYKTVRNLPDTFDEKALSRYQKYIWRLKEIPLSDLLRLRQCMGKKAWRSELDFLNFIYRYYNMKANMTLAQMQSAN
jgi:hypothetical protein